MPKKLTYEYVKNFIENLGYKLLDKEYVNNHKKLTLETKEGYKCVINFNNIASGYTPRIFDKLNPYTIENIHKWIDINNKSFKLISDIYYGSKEKKMIFKCDKCNSEWDMTWNNIVTGSDCPFCQGYRVNETNCLATKRPYIAKEWHPTKNGDLTSHDITWCSETKVWWVCLKCGHEWDALVSNRVSANSGCPKCASSLGEKLIKEFLDKFLINHITQFIFPDCKYKNPLRFDFYLPNYNLLIEYQGEQHYRPVDYWGGNDEFIVQQLKDQIKRDYCKNNNINLLEIKYTEIKNINGILYDKLVA